MPLVIEVADRGISIAEVIQPMLFQTFQQLTSRNTKTFHGTVIGLALTRHWSRVEAQGGTVGVRSTLGIGRVFFLTLPCLSRAEI